MLQKTEVYIARPNVPSQPWQFLVLDSEKLREYNSMGLNTQVRVRASVMLFFVHTGAVPSAVGNEVPTPRRLLGFRKYSLLSHAHFRIIVLV